MVSALAAIALPKDHASTPHLTSEVGLIPSDWASVKLRQISRPVRGGSPRPAGDPRYFNGSYIPWLTVAALTNIPVSRIVVSATATCLTEEGANHSRTLEAGTLIIANSGATLGVAKILGLRCCANDGIAALLDLSEALCPRFLVHYINAKTEYLREVVARGNGQPNLNTTLIGDFSVPAPPTRKEQEAIAEALSDADALIESLEALIAKKRAIKQGAMHDLLSGRKRLPGFKAAWATKKFGGLVTIRNQKVNTFGNAIATFCVELENIGSNSGRLLDCSDATDRSSSKYSFQRGDVLFGRLRPYLRKFWQADRDGVCSTEIWPLIPSSAEILPDYLYQSVQTEGFIDAASSSYGTHMPRSDWKALRDYEITLPTEAGEQQAIATILCEIDSETAALEAKLEKVRQIKQGMMQELLTGRVRLV